MDGKKVLLGRIVHSKSRQHLEILHEAAIGVDEAGIICFVDSDVTSASEARKKYPAFEHATPITLKPLQFLVPAHCIHLSERDIALLAARGAGVAHNTNSNTCLRDGECRVRSLLDAGVKVGLGTDCSAGYSISVLDAMRQASTDLSGAKTVNIYSQGLGHPGACRA